MNPPSHRKSVTVIGAGNIGSFLLPLLARMPSVGAVTIVDHASYDEAKNLVSQAISPADLGLPKADVQARRLRQINPSLWVMPIINRLENVPWGALRADVIVGCLDSRHARRVLSQIAVRLGVPLVDAGVHADGMLARVHVFRNGESSPCVECSWDERNYAQLERYSCDGTPIEAAPTNAPACLGALAAAMQAIEVQKILADDWDHVADGEVMLDARSHRHCVTRLVRNRSCRFDHRTFAVKEFFGSTTVLTLRDLFAAGLADLRVGGQKFCGQWACAACQSDRELFGLRDRIAVACPGCGRQMRAIGYNTLEKVTIADIPAGMDSVPLATLGICAGDIFSGSVAGEHVHFELIDQSLCKP